MQGSSESSNPRDSAKPQVGYYRRIGYGHRFGYGRRLMDLWVEMLGNVKVKE
ncbi:hypothetical protein F2Q69_00048101 [Brassica cretica]|uniref:Uncharacterized protein n=1 Tax=Brassica cretica TaxID=69181 RepID=A0A8S9PXE4_BRACR|nr:hypothetical protein F2Q69_00048101 [Brassica cretica]